MAQKISNIFEGKWNVIRFEYYTKDGKWELYDQFAEGEYCLEFLPSKQVEIGKLLSFEGQLLEHCKEREPINTKYYYNIEGDNHILIIDRSTYLEDGSIDVCEEEWHTIGQAKSKQSLYLNLIDEPTYLLPTTSIISEFYVRSYMEKVRS